MSLNTDIQTDNLKDSCDLSVIILTHNTMELLRTALSSIYKGTKDISFEIIVVDNNSVDGTSEMMGADFSDTLYIFNDKNYGFTKGNNIGIEKSRGKYVLLLNSDTEITDSALGKMTRFMDSNPDCGIMGCKLLNSDSSIQYSCRRFPSYGTAIFNRYSILTRLFPRNRFSQTYLMSKINHDETREVDWVSGAALMARRSAFIKIGILDERFISYSEDVDWCYRMHEAGWKVYYYPDAEIYHYIGQTSSKYPYKYITIRHISMYLFYRKHYSRSIKSIDYLVLLGVSMRCVWNVAGAFVKSMLR
jgi:GT2 family glycosyltransferase